MKADRQTLASKPSQFTLAEYERRAGSLKLSGVSPYQVDDSNSKKVRLVEQL